MSILFVDKVITEILSNTFFSNEIVFSPKFSAITCLAKSIFPCAISFFINSSISISLSVFLFDDVKETGKEQLLRNQH